MRKLTAVVAPGMIVLGTIVALAGADTEPVFVVPGRPDVPVIINGQDVSGAVIEGDWGLGRPQIGITIIQRRPYPGRHSAGPARFAPVGRFFPTIGKPPRVGRLEVLPPVDRLPPPPAQSFKQSWEVRSDPLPPTSGPYYATPPRRRDRPRHGSAQPE